MDINTKPEDTLNFFEHARRGEFPAPPFMKLLEMEIAEVGDGESRLCRVDPGSPLPISVARPATKYEMKAHETGSSVTELIWKRR